MSINEVLPSGAKSKAFDPDSKFKILGRGSLLAPACCASCGGSDAERRYLDLGLFYDFEGQVYFCTICVEEMAETIGLLNSTELEFLQELNTKLAADYSELKNRYEEEHERLQHFDSLFAGLTGPSSDDVNVTVESESESNAEPVSDGDDESSDITESVEGEGSTDTLWPERDDESYGLQL